MLLIETGFILLALLTAFLHPSLGSKQLQRAEKAFTGIANRRGMAILAVGIATMLLRAALLPVLPIPEPIVHDEFGYLLAADTFAHGRLTNTTHPMWIHFETFSVLQKPTYQCFAPPAQGMILALGKVVFGHPFWGVLLTVGLMCSSITWMLQGWLSNEWALLGGILATLRYAIFSYWANSYWGGAVAAIGGALVLGALPRIMQSHRIRDAVWMGVGLAILANSRPYEGFVFSLPVAVVLLLYLVSKRRIPFRVSLQRMVLPLALILSLTAAGMGYYLWRVTGSPFHMPYQIERETYAVAPLMLWQQVRPEPVYHHEVIRKMYAEDLDGFRTARSLVAFAAKGAIAWIFFLGPLLTLPVLMLAVVLPRDFSWRNIDHSTALLLFVFCAFVFGSALETYYSPHYSAPAMGLILALIVIALRRLRNWGKSGMFLARTLPLVCVISFMTRAVASPLHITLGEFYEFSWCQKGAHSFGRAAIQKTLQEMPGNHLVLVRYKPEHRPFEEWVYNDADIDHSKVVWAREMDSPENQQLLDYFKNRQAWLLEADETPPRLSPWQLHQTAGSSARDEAQRE